MKVLRKSLRLTFALVMLDMRGCSEPEGIPTEGQRGPLPGNKGTVGIERVRYGLIIIPTPTPASNPPHMTRGGLFDPWPTNFDIGSAAHDMRSLKGRGPFQNLWQF